MDIKKHPHFASCLEAFQRANAEKFPAQSKPVPLPEVELSSVGMHAGNRVYRVSTRGQLSVEGAMLLQAFAAVSDQVAFSRSEHAVLENEQSKFLLNGSVYIGENGNPTYDFVLPWKFVAPVAPKVA